MRRLLGPLLLALLLVLVLLGLGPASAMTDQVVRAPLPPPAPAPPAAGPVAAPARVRALPLAPLEPADHGVWPLQPTPQVVRGFDPPATTWGSGHRGVDLRGQVGQTVHTALAGEVVHAGRLAGRGVVVVSHGATRTTYEPVDASVRRGALVATGEVIGTLEWSASHCLPFACLHWGLRRGESYLDPLGLLGGPRPVRLYPW